MKRILSFVAIAAALSGCSLGQIKGDIAPPAANESIFIVGVNPENFRISVFSGSVKDGRFVQGLMPAVVYGGAVDGYVVGKAAAGAVLAITMVRVVPDSNAFFSGQNFVACGDAKTMVFEVPKGKVIYLGSLNYAFSDDKLKIASNIDLDAANHYIKASLPSLVGRLEYLEPQLMPTGKSCSPGTIYLPIYLPRK